MHLQTGELVRLSEALGSARLDPYDNDRDLGKLNAEYERLLVALGDEPYTTVTDEEFATLEPMSKPRRKNWMRNQKCPCKSGRKFKNCCWGQWA